MLSTYVGSIITCAQKTMEDKGPLIIAACWAFTGLSLLFVAARLFVRLAVYNKLMSDDYWIILSTVRLFLSSSPAQD